jgi:hypothetical protein
VVVEGGNQWSGAEIAKIRVRPLSHGWGLCPEGEESIAEGIGMSQICERLVLLLNTGVMCSRQCTTTPLGVVDTGADKSYIGSRAFQMCQSLNVPVSKSDKHQYVHLANQSTADIIGSLEIPIQLQG